MTLPAKRKRPDSWRRMIREGYRRGCSFSLPRSVHIQTGQTGLHRSSASWQTHLVRTPGVGSSASTVTSRTRSFFRSFEVWD